MKPLIQEWHIAITQVAPPDLENLYVCAVIGFCDPDIPLCTAADISLDEFISICNGPDVVHRLGFGGIIYFVHDHVAFKTFRNNCAMNSNHVNLLIPTETIHWFLTNKYIWDICSFLPIINRLDAGEYLWIRKNKMVGHASYGNLSAKGFLRSNITSTTSN